MVSGEIVTPTFRPHIRPMPSCSLQSDVLWVMAPKKKKSTREEVEELASQGFSQKEVVAKVGVKTRHSRKAPKK